jgi:long-subunit acyl-CoA synthetase (AMP-forming)
MSTPAPITVCEGFQRSKLVDPDAVAFRSPGDVIAVTWREYDERVRALAAGFDALGVRHGDVVAFMMRNRPEFALVDAAAMHVGAACLSVYNTSSPEQLAFVLGHARAKVVVCEEIMLDRILKSGAPLEQIVCVDGPAEGATLTLAELGRVGLESAATGGFDFEAAWRAVRPDDVCALIYTSGTTGDPKGVQITHRAIVDQVLSLEEIVPTHFGDRMTSFMPAAHIGDRIVSLYWMELLGTQTTYVEDPKTIGSALLDSRPTLWFAVPRVWEKFRGAIEAKISAETDEAKRAYARQAVELGRTKARAWLAGEELGEEELAAWAKADELVLSQLRVALGLDQIRVALCGAAPIAQDTLEFFLAIGVKIAEVWGMTETTGIGTIVPPNAMKLGTVGIAYPGSEVTLAEDGELLFRGPSLMSGYRNAPELTAEAIDADGWLHTGDVAIIDEDGYVKIVDRKKELIISAAGKNMSPANIENAIKAHCPLIATVVLIGDAKPYNTALITLDPDACAAYAARVGLPDASADALAADLGVQAVVQTGVDAGNATLSRVEQVKKHVVLPVFWEPGGDELTPTMKLRRKPIAEKYAEEIGALYA